MKRHVSIIIDIIISSYLRQDEIRRALDIPVVEWCRWSAPQPTANVWSRGALHLCILEKNKQILHLAAVWRILDVYPGSRILIFTHQKTATKERSKKKLYNFLLKKNVPKFSEVWVWDPGSGKNLFRIPWSKRHRIPDPDPQQCLAVKGTYGILGRHTKYGREQVSGICVHCIW